ncbi:hypothetical protein ABI003_15325, partial [Enterococcus faecium]|uniref:hypothetical protein n=1 Tax=Enterococcus faecium TaxID=1352 RepID=UPI003F42552D
RKNALWYHNNLEKKEGWVYPPLIDGATYSHYVIRVPDRDKVVLEMAKHGIHVGTLIQYSIPAMESYNHLKTNAPVSL